MTPAQKIMKKKANFRTEIESRLTKAESEAVWQKATERLDALLDQYASLEKGVHIHTDNKIFPAAAIYLTLKETVGQQEAYRIMETASYTTADAIARKLAPLMRIPPVRSLFIRMWDPLTRKLFGEKCGFRNVFYPRKKGEYRMDVISCPYFRYFSELGCPEVTKISCGADDHVYGSLPGLKFERTTTIGRGGERCDFCIKKA